MCLPKTTSDQHYVHDANASIQLPTYHLNTILLIALLELFSQGDYCSIVKPQTDVDEHQNTQRTH